jgi:hypothetical protein
MTTINSTPNYSKKTFTLRKYDERGKFISKYRTLPMSQDDFDENEYNGSDDWANFLKTSNEYRIVK